MSRRSAARDAERAAIAARPPLTVYPPPEAPLSRQEPPKPGLGDEDPAERIADLEDELETERGRVYGLRQMLLTSVLKHRRARYEVGYTGGQGAEVCSRCQFFFRGTCDIVRGPIEDDGLCVYFNEDG